MVTSEAIVKKFTRIDFFSEVCTLYYKGKNNFKKKDKIHNPERGKIKIKSVGPKFYSYLENSFLCSLVYILTFKLTHIYDNCIIISVP